MMKASVVFLALCAAVISAGCFCKAIPKSKSLGHLDVSKEAASFQAFFTPPTMAASGFTLVFHDGKDNTRDHCGHPSWPLEVTLEIRTKADKSFLLAKDFGANDFQFTNWHSPDSSVALQWDVWLAGVLRQGKEYQLVLKVKKPAPDLGEAEVFFHWIVE